MAGHFRKCVVKSFSKSQKKNSRVNLLCVFGPVNGRPLSKMRCKKFFEKSSSKKPVFGPVNGRPLSKMRCKKFLEKRVEQKTWAGQWPATSEIALQKVFRKVVERNAHAPHHDSQNEHTMVECVTPQFSFINYGKSPIDRWGTRCDTDTFLEAPAANLVLKIVRPPKRSIERDVSTMFESQRNDLVESIVRSFGACSYRDEIVRLLKS